MSLFSRFFNRSSGRDALAPLYGAVIAQARDPWWYIEGGVADTIDGRFDMVAAILSIILVRLEQDADEGAANAALLTEIFVDDMDGQLRQQGIGDIVVGKHIGKMMSALGGRLSSYRDALSRGDSLEEPLARNLYRGEPPVADRLARVESRMQALADAVTVTPVDALLAGRMPTP